MQVFGGEGMVCGEGWQTFALCGGLFSFQLWLNV